MDILKFQKFAGLAALAVGLSLGLSGPATAEMRPAELIKALQAGGYVVYMRHTKTEKSQEDLDHSNLANCATQRNLSEEGREQARVIGRAVNSLGIKFEPVLTSPYCRARDTSVLAFGGGRNFLPLRYLSHQPESEQPGSIEEIERVLSTAPQSGANSIMVAQTENLKQTTGIWPKDSGVMHIFRPKGDGYEHLGKIGPGEWPVLVAQLGPKDDDRSCFLGFCW